MKKVIMTTLLLIVMCISSVCAQAPLTLSIVNQKNTSMKFLGSLPTEKSPKIEAGTKIGEIQLSHSLSKTMQFTTNYESILDKSAVVTSALKIDTGKYSSLSLESKTQGKKTENSMMFQANTGMTPMLSKWMTGNFSYNMLKDDTVKKFDFALTPNSVLSASGGLVSSDKANTSNYNLGFTPSKQLNVKSNMVREKGITTTSYDIVATPIKGVSYTQNIVSKGGNKTSNIKVSAALNNLFVDHSYVSKDAKNNKISETNIRMTPFKQLGMAFNNTIINEQKTTTMDIQTNPLDNLFVAYNSKQSTGKPTDTVLNIKTSPLKNLAIQHIATVKDGIQTQESNIQMAITPTLNVQRYTKNQGDKEFSELKVQSSILFKGLSFSYYDKIDDFTNNNFTETNITALLSKIFQVHQKFNTVNNLNISETNIVANASQKLTFDSTIIKTENNNDSTKVGFKTNPNDKFAIEGSVTKADKEDLQRVAFTSCPTKNIGITVDWQDHEHSPTTQKVYVELFKGKANSFVGTMTNSKYDMALRLNPMKNINISTTFTSKSIGDISIDYLLVGESSLKLSRTNDAKRKSEIFALAYNRPVKNLNAADFTVSLESFETGKPEIKGQFNLKWVW